MACRELTRILRDVPRRLYFTALPGATILDHMKSGTIQDGSQEEEAMTTVYLGINLDDSYRKES